MRKTISILLCLMMLSVLLLLSVPAEDSDILTGKASLRYAGADSMKIDGKEFASSGEGASFTLDITVTGCETKYNTVYFNDTELGVLSEGLNTFELDTGALTEGENHIRIALTASASPYDETMVYGKYNLDDIVVNSVSFSGLSIEKPDAVDLFMSIAASAGYNIKRASYSPNLSVGDGWISETGLGGSTPNVPIGCSFVFEKPDLSGLFALDTSLFADGSYEAEFFSGTTSLGKKTLTVDNSSPVIIFSAADNAKIASNGSLTFKVEDTTECDVSLTVDGKKASKIDCSKLSEGSHTATVTASDSAGHKTVRTLVFNIVSSRLLDVTIGKTSVTMTAYADAEIYGAQLLTDIRMFQNRLGEFDMKSLRSEDEVQVSFDDKAELITSSVGNTLPYQSFVINTDGRKGDVIVSYTGTTGNGSDIVLKAWNYTESRWDVVARTPSGESISFPVDTAVYSKSEKMRINAMPYLISNGSNTVLWNSDTQYYSRYDDLNEVYYAINNYAAEEYAKGNIGYCIHTGDLIDRTNVGDETAYKEFAVASKAQAILDSASVPNGVVSGNHDIQHDTADYSYFWKYFGKSRYEDFEWYGGSLNNNMHHYDLMTIGAFDFVFLYIGTYMENNDETIAWANAVCRAYPERNVIICTHEYITSTGAYSGDRAHVIFDEIAVPNENVKMILCGHYEGVCDQLHQVGDSDRYVLEILADYQFAELGRDPQHVENGCTCDGEGFVRLMSFTEAGQLVSTTYSPTADITNFYPSYLDSFVYDLDLIESNRSICTSEFNVIYDPDDLGSFGRDEIDLSKYGAFYASFGEGSDAVLSQIYVIGKYKTGDKAANDPHNYDVTFEKVSSSGLTGVSENLSRVEKVTRPDGTLVEVGLDLLPDSASKLSKTSGTNAYKITRNDDGSISVYHENDSNGTWVTLISLINAEVDMTKYNRLYFGVSADKSTKWNLYINFTKLTLNFSQDLNGDFGYVNAIPSDITGSWQGYIDLSEYITGSAKLSSIYLVAATPDTDVTFDYYFLGSSDAGKVRCITDENTVSAVEMKIGSTVEAPASPYRAGYVFDGWYTLENGGEKVSFPITVGSEITEIYAHFTEKSNVQTAKYYDTEIILDRAPVSKIVLICLCFLLVIGMTAFLFFKKAKSKQGDK